MEEQLLTSFENAPYFISLLAGILTFLSPCVLPLVPAYLSYITGMSAKQLASGDKLDFSSKLKVIESSLLFILGFSVVFMAMGTMMAGLIENIFIYKWIPWLAGGIIIVFGLHFIGIIKLKFLFYEKRVNIDTSHIKDNKGFWGNTLRVIYPFLLGLAFALGWTPCIGPIFASIISLAASDSSMGVSLMGAYTIGLAIPFFISAMLTDYFISFFDKFKHHLRKVEIVSGALLIIIGVMIITGDLGILSIYLMDIFGI